MSKFITELNVKCVSDNLWLLCDTLVFKSTLIGTVKVPSGFLTDFASVPRVPIAYIFFGDRAHREAVIHDYLYRTDSKPSVTKHTADKVFLEAMKDRGKSWFVRSSMYLGVCLGGGFSYHKRNVMDEFI